MYEAQHRLVFKATAYLGEVVRFDNSVEQSLVQLSEQFALHAASRRSRLELTTADVLDTLQTTSQLLDEFQLVLQPHTHTRLTALCPGLPRWAGTRKVKPVWILQKQETVSGSGISWAICKSAPRSRQITTPAPHHSVFYRPDALLPPNQQRQSTEGKVLQPDTGSSTRILGGLYGGSYVGLTVGCSSTRLSVCLSRRSTAATAAGGFAAEHPEGRIYRSIAAGCNEEWIVPHAYHSDAFTYNLG